MERSNRVMSFCLATAVCFSVGYDLASAQQSQTVAAVVPNVSCLEPVVQVDVEGLNQFLAKPEVLLEQYSAGGLSMSNRVRELVGSNSRAFEKVMALSARANKEQKSAIAAGLARVVFACGNSIGPGKQDFAALVQSSVASSEDADLIDAFQLASNDIKVASIGSSPGGSALGGGAISGGDDAASGANGYRYAGENPGATTSGSYTIGNVNPFGSSVRRISQDGS